MISNSTKCEQLRCGYYRACKGICTAKNNEPVSLLLKCPQGRWATDNIRTTVILPTRNEDGELSLTVDSWKEAGADQIVVIDDGGKDVPEDSRYDLIVNDIAKGPAICRNMGADIAEGNVLIFSDSHVRVNGSVMDVAKESIDKGGVICSQISPIGGRDWTGYGASLSPVDAGYECKYNMKQPNGAVSGLIGSVYVLPKYMLWECGGWLPTWQWGYNEQSLSMALHFANINIFPSEKFHCGHLFKNKFNYEVQGSISHANRVLAHWLLFSDKEFNDKWKPKFEKYLKDGWNYASPKLSEFESVREKYQSLRKITDAEFYDRIEERNINTIGGTVKAKQSTKPDTPVVTVGLYTAHAPGREPLFDQYKEGISKLGYPIKAVTMMCDSNRPDVLQAYPKATHLKAETLQLRDARSISTHLSDLWNQAIPTITRDVDWVLSVEDDVIPSEDALKRMMAHANQGVGIISTPLRSRRGHLMVYSIKSIDPFELIRYNRFSKHKGVHPVGSVHLGCTLIRSDILRNFRFTPAPNGNGDQGGWGHEWSLMKMTHRLELKIICDFDISMKHLDQEKL